MDDLKKVWDIAKISILGAEKSGCECKEDIALRRLGEFLREKGVRDDDS